MSASMFIKPFMFLYSIGIFFIALFLEISVHSGGTRVDDVQNAGVEVAFRRLCDSFGW